MKFHGEGADTVRIVLADDQELVLAGICSLLEGMDGLEVIAQARSGEELVRVLGDMRPDLVMTDLSMPGMNGIVAIEHIHRQYPDLKIIVLTGHAHSSMARSAMAAGACGYVVKDATPVELHQAVRIVVSGGTYLSSSISRALVADPPHVAAQLTGRQREIVKLMAQGFGSKEIGHRLGLSSKTVDGHRSRIMKRLDLYDLASLARYAVREGLVEP